MKKAILCCFVGSALFFVENPANAADHNAAPSRRALIKMLKGRRDTLYHQTDLYQERKIPSVKKRFGPWPRSWRKGITWTSEGGWYFDSGSARATMARYHFRLKPGWRIVALEDLVIPAQSPQRSALFAAWQAYKKSQGKRTRRFSKQIRAAMIDAMLTLADRGARIDPETETLPTDPQFYETLKIAGFHSPDYAYRDSRYTTSVILLPEMGSELRKIRPSR